MYEQARKHRRRCLLLNFPFSAWQGGQWGKDRDRVYITESGKVIADFLDRRGAEQAGGQLQIEPQGKVHPAFCGSVVLHIFGYGARNCRRSVNTWRAMQTVATDAILNSGANY
mgnify:CR=1 FL=1